MKKLIIGIVLLVLGFAGYITVSLVWAVAELWVEHVIFPLIVSCVLGLLGLKMCLGEVYHKKNHFKADSLEAAEIPQAPLEDDK